jgi:hypothetical protein
VEFELGRTSQYHLKLGHCFIMESNLGVATKATYWNIKL